MPIALDNLKESNEFLNLILENINSAILIADENMRIHQFNKSFLSLFDHAADRVIESSFGQISGCVNAVKENKACGGTSQCQFCVLRKTLLQTLVEDYPVDRKAMERIFYIKGIPVLKNLEVTSRLIQFHGQKMILVIIYDVSEIEEQKKNLKNSSSFGAAFGQEEKQLHAGDRLILYTDGLIENFGTDGEREGKDRFHAFMEKSHHLPTKDLVDRVFEDANRQRGGSAPSDDMSLIAVEYTKR